MIRFNKAGLVFLAIVLFSCGPAAEKEKLPYFNTPDFTPQWELPPEAARHRVASFRLQNQAGEAVSSESLRGRITVANFFFTTCGSICPRMMHNLQKVAAAFTADPSVRLLSFTVLPEVDSVPRLQAYAQRLGLDGRQWWLLTGNKDSIYRLARRSYFADEETGYDRGSGEFLHTENAVLVDGRGFIRGVYNATLELEMEKLVRHIRLLQEE